jgi:hypothetical protein
MQGGRAGATAKTKEKTAENCHVAVMDSSHWPTTANVMCNHSQKVQKIKCKKQAAREVPKAWARARVRLSSSPPA